MISVFLFGLVMGVRHAFEADHLAAVATLATRARGPWSGLVQGAAWGLGHTLTLLLVGGTCLLLGAAVPERWAVRLELVVGFMLLALGVDTLLRMRRARIHAHVHEHEDGRAHWHVHRHETAAVHEDAAAHQHPHAGGAFPVRALAVGLVHGLAGSAALFLLTLQTVRSFWPGLAYIALFGIGSIVGMAGLSAVVVLPIRAATERATRIQGVIEAVVGCSTIAIGMRVIWSLLQG
ncbi:MAG: urease accessory protein [Vicinamibacteria bacterium]